MRKDTTPYEVLVDERVEKDLEKVPNYVIEKFLRLLDECEKNPIRSRSGFDVKPMEGYPDNKKVRITTAQHRGDAYK